LDWARLELNRSPPATERKINMKRATKLFLIFLFLCSFHLSSRPGVTEGAPSPGAVDRPPFRHAYYLFLSGTPSGCEDCYVPLLITAAPLEKAAKAPTKAACALVITYERDSIWHNDGMVSVAPEEIEASPRIIHLRGRKYRYQEISSAEALRLFEHPQGTIPVSRPVLPQAASPGPSLEDLASAFR